MMKTAPEYKIAGLILIGALWAVMILPYTASAQVVDNACDPSFVDAVEMRGWLEAQREVTQNQNYLFKPDSVLEYSCFTQFVDAVGVKIAPRFSETDYWGDLAGISELSTDIALERAVHEAFVPYLQANFSHTYRGGRLPPQDEPDIQKAPGDYICNAMAYVWENTKCINFMEWSRFYDPDIPDELNIDGFYDFEYYRNRDPRVFPPQYAACAVPSASYDIAIPIAYNQQQDYYVFEESERAEIGYERDTITTHLEYIMPDSNCGVGRTPESGEPIPTGIRVYHFESVDNMPYEQDPDWPDSYSYQEHFCANPGCSYDGGTCVRN